MLLRYLRSLNTARSVLWCYFIWYLVTVASHFDPSPRLWLTSLGLSGIIGFGLLLSTAHAGPVPTRLNRWQVARLFLMPFCVSSFAALIKDEGYTLIFSPHATDNILVLGACSAFVASVWFAKRTVVSRPAHQHGVG